MRHHRVSWRGDDGELMLDAPPVYVERPGMRKPFDASTRGRRSDLIHFARLGSRVTRWLLNHPGESTTVGALANELLLPESTVSRSISALRKAGYIEMTTAQDDRRSKPIRLTGGSRLLEQWSDHWRKKQLRVISLDIGTESVRESIELVRSVARSDGGSQEWMLGGLNGAATIARAVEPADLFIWIKSDQLDNWLGGLVAVEAPRGRANLRLAIADDPWIFTLADRRSSWADGKSSKQSPRLPVADRAQIYLDCGREGERALEAADALRRTMGL
jgi:DNA-binding MarR family transcriptional regulator